MTDEIENGPQSSALTKGQFDAQVTATLEYTCANYLRDGEVQIDSEDISSGIGVDPKSAVRLLKYLVNLGAIELQTIHSGPGRHFFGGSMSIYRISPSVLAVNESWKVFVVRQSEPSDKVLDATNWVRRHPVLAYLAIALITVTAIASALNSIVSLYDRFTVAN
jgi:hypothetical protein